MPAPGASTVDCLAEAVAPTPPVVTDNCNNTLTPSAPVASADPTCGGTKTYTFTYTDCAGKTYNWVYTYTIREPVVTLPAPGASTVDCLAEAVAPTPPVVTDNCNNTLTPSAPVASADPACGGTKTYTFTYSDCAGKTYNWVYTYTIREPVVTLPAPGASTVDCLTEAVAPTPPVVTDNCNNTLTPSAPVASADPACGGTKTYTFTYSDCAGKTYNWVYTYTIREPVVTLPAPGASTVDCLTEAVAPTPPTVTDNCNNTLSPSAPVASANPACGGTKTYTFTYTDCAGKTYNWVYTYTIREPVVTLPAPGNSTVDCLAEAVAPTPPVVTDNCNNTLTPSAPVASADPACGGTKTYTFTYTDCAGKTYNWVYTYTIREPVVTLPAPGNSTVDCLTEAVAPTPPVVTDNCNNTLTPSAPVASANPACGGTKTYTFTYSDCAGKTYNWVYTYTIREPEWQVPASGSQTVECPGNITTPIPPAVTDNCGRPVTATMSPTPAIPTCSGTVVYTFTYTDCAGNTKLWTFTYTIKDDTAPSIDCQTNLTFCEDVSGNYLITPANAGKDNCNGPVTVSYTISGTTTRSGTGNDASGVFNPGISTITWIVEDQCGNTNSCVTAINIQARTNPEFDPIAPVCEGEPAPALPTTSKNGISGTWSPSVINNTATTIYTFTPTPGQCANQTQIIVTVNPKRTPAFNAAGPFCQNTAAPALPATSNNGISGTWSPAVINTSQVGTTVYTFTPNPGQCASQATMSIEITNQITPTFIQIGPLCQNTTPPALPASSNNNPQITGKWNPAEINTSQTGATVYTFTPDPGQCAVEVTMTIEITTEIIPVFQPIGPLCHGSTPPALPSLSANNPPLSGTWSPATISTNTLGTFNYTFTPDAGQCASPVTIQIVVTGETIPAFASFADLCQGDQPPVLPLISDNNIRGSWLPSLVNNQTTTTYVFTPDADYCAEKVIITIKVNPKTTPVFEAIAPLCEGDSPPALPLVSTNGIRGTWNPSTIDNTRTLTYIFTPDAGECATQVQKTVLVNPKTTPTFDQIGPICEGATPPLLPTVSKNSVSGKWTPAIIDNTNTGTYTFTPDAEFCASSVQMTVAIIPLPAIPSVTVTDPTCVVATGSFVVTSPTAGLTFSLNGGAFAAYPASGYAGLTFSLDGGAFAAYPASGYAGLNSGNHTLQVRNADGCTNSFTITIGTAPGATDVPQVMVTDPTCEVATGSFVVTSATAGLTFSLDGGAFVTYPASGYAGLNSGNHTLQVRNADGCTNSVTFTIGSAPGAPEVPQISVTDPTCEVATGSFVVTSPTTGLTFSIDGGAFAAYPASGYAGLNSGNHTLQVRNAEGCTNSVTVTIGSAPGAPEVPQVSVTDPTCEVATGSFVVTSPTAGLTFSLNGGAFAAYPASGYAGLNSGNHTLQVRNADGCTNSVTITIGAAPGAPDVPQVTVTDPTCEVATGSFVVTSPTAGLTFSLNGGAFAAYPASGYAGLNSGNHTLQVRNADGCTNSVTITIGAAPGAPDPPFVTVTDPTCEVATGSFVVTSPTAGLTFSLNGSAFTAYPASGYAGLNSGNHTLQVRNAEGCTNSVTVTIGSVPSVPEEPTVEITQPDILTPTGSFIITSPTTGLTFSLNNGTFSTYPAGGFAGLSEGKYILVVRNDAGCDNFTEFFIIPAPSAPPEPRVDVLHPTCDNPTGSFIITSPTNDLVFRINNGSFEPYPAGGYKNLPAGTYTLSAMGNNGVAVSINLVINPAPEAPDVPSIIVTQPSCEIPAGSIIITSSTNNLTFSFNGEPFAPYPSGGYANISPGTYSLIVKNQDACTSSKEVILVAAPGVPDDFAVCCGTAPIILKNLPVIYPQGGVFYWQGSAIEEFSPDCRMAGNHLITYRYVDSLTSLASECSFTITVYPQPALKNLTPVLCEDPATPGIANHINLPDYNASISTQPNLSFTWFTDQNLTEVVANPGNTSVSNNFTYYVKVQNNQSGCHQTALVTFMVSDNLGVKDLTVDLCENTATLKEFHNLQLTTYNQDVFAGSQGTTYRWFTDAGLNNPVTQTLIPIVRHNDMYFVEVTQGNCKNVAAVTFVISDNTPPEMYCRPHTAYLNSMGLVTVTVWDVDDGSTDNCTIGLYFLNHLSQKVKQLEFNCNDIGENIVRLYGSDPSGNTDFCNALVTVKDTIPPVARCRPPFTIFLQPGGTFTLTPSDINNGSTDECGIIDEKLNRTFFTCTDIGTHTIRLTVFDPSGNSDYCETQITIIGNVKPEAADDHEKVAANQPKIMIPLLNDKDSGPQGGLNPLSFSLITPPQHGTVTVNPLNGSVIYTPQKDYIGADTFVYVICDNGIPCEVLCDSATVYIQVLPPNHPPVASDKVFDVGCNGIAGNILRGLPNIHDADYDPDGNDIFLRLPLISQPSNGTLNIGEDGSFFYIPSAGYVGIDFLVYEICDNGFPQMCDTAKITFLVFEDANCDDIPDIPPTVLFIPEGFSPNGDDVHDFFRISGIEDFPEAKMIIFNRWGNKVFEKEKYGNLSYWGSDQEAWWWGISEARGVIGSGRRVPVGNYLYLLNIGNGKTITGTVMVSY
ncbi:MAG: gliding motility-associated C-terminal domain-containing protein [Bacteroidota bacterium]